VSKERLERYSLGGAENQAAVAAGVAGGDWFRSAVPRKRMKELMRRSDYPAVRSIWAAYKEIVPAVLRQLRDQEYYVRRELPTGPYSSTSADGSRPALRRGPSLTLFRTDRADTTRFLVLHSR
jgi:hypothetical protein